MRLESTWSDHTQTCIFHTHSYSPVLSPMSGNMLPPMGGAYSYGVANGMSPMGNSNTIVGSPMMTAATSPSYNVKSLPRVASTHADDNWPACRHSMLVRVDFSSVTRAVLMYSPSPSHQMGVQAVTMGMQQQLSPVNKIHIHDCVDFVRNCTPLWEFQPITL